VTSGDTAGSPLAAFAVPSVEAAPGTASLSVVTPQQGVDPASWTGAVMSGPSTFPATGSPVSIYGAGLPVVAGQPGDPTLADYVAGNPSSVAAPDGGTVYELRLTTSGADGIPTYSSTDIEVLGSTWRQLTPAPDASDVSLVAQPTGPDDSGSGLMLVATMTPVTAYGTVTFLADGKPLGSRDSQAIRTSWLPKDVGGGHHVFTAVFTPTSTFTPSQASVSYDAAAQTPVTVPVSKKPKKHHNPDHQTIKVKVPKVKVKGEKHTKGGTGNGSDLPFTGTDVAGMAVLAGELLLGGALLARSGKRRKRPAQP
jgi:hypothetical protein